MLCLSAKKKPRPVEANSWTTWANLPCKLRAKLGWRKHSVKASLLRIISEGLADSKAHLLSMISFSQIGWDYTVTVDAISSALLK